MISYFRYLFFSFIKRTSFYVFLVFSVVGITIPFVFNTSFNVVDILRFGYFYVFFFVFLVLIVIHIFKDQEKNGTDVFVFSTKLTRKKILLTKFLTCFFFLFLFQILTIFIATIFSFIDQSVSFEQKIIFLLSIFIGEFIIGFIVISIIILLSTFMSKKWLSISWSIFIFTFLFVSYIASFLAGTSNMIFSFPIEKTKTFIVQKKENFETKSHKYFLNNNQRILNDDNKLVNFEDYQERIRNKNLMYLDFGFQINEFFNLFLDGTSEFRSREVIKDTQMIYEDANNLSINVKDKDYVFLYDASLNSSDDKTRWTKWKKVNEEFYNFINYALSSKETNLIKSFYKENVQYNFNELNSQNKVQEKTIFDKSSLEGNLIFINTMFFVYQVSMNNLKNSSSNEQSKKESEENKKPFSPVIKNELPQKYQESSFLNKELLEKLTNKNAFFVKRTLLFDRTPIAFWVTKNLISDKPNLFSLEKGFLKENKIISNLINTKEKIEVFTKRDWIPKWILFSIWIPFSLILITISWIFYYRKDLK